MQRSLRTSSEKGTASPRKITKTLRLGLLAIAIAGVLQPIGAVADCGRGKVATYDDITDIAVRRCGVAPAIYRFVADDKGFIELDGRFKTPVKGAYYGRDGQALFAALVDILKKGAFYSMQLAPSPVLYVDGPCEAIEVLRCGVATAIGGLGVDMLPFEADVNDPRTSQFTALLNEMQVTIFAWRWQNEMYQPSSTPSSRPIASP